MKTQKDYVGIDISKDDFDVAITYNGVYRHFKFTNNLKGFKELLKKLNADHWVVMEASGPYYLKLSCYLHENGIAVSVVNPLVIKRFCQMRMVRAKTDKKDAQMIAEYGKTEQPAAWEPDQPFMMELKQMVAALALLTKTRTAFERQLEAFGENPTISATCIESINKVLKEVAQQEAAIEKQMQAIIQKQYGEVQELLLSIPGIGPKTSALLIIATDGFTKFFTAKQLISYLGLCPRIYSSGKSVRGKSKITKMGVPRVRASLYMCTRSAKRCNKACKELYDRLIKKGKRSKVANVAVANKLVKQAFAIATKKQFYTAA
jgi:transposase